MWAFLHNGGAGLLVGVVGILGVGLYVLLYLRQIRHPLPQPGQAKSPEQEMCDAKELFARAAQSVILGRWLLTHEGKYIRLTELASPGYLLEQLSNRTSWPIRPHQMVRVTVLALYMDQERRVSELFLEMAADADANIPLAIVEEPYLNPDAGFLNRVEVDARRLREWVVVLASTA